MRCLANRDFLNNVELKQISNQQGDFILNLSGVVIAILFFISGIGSYRIILVYAVHCLIRALNIEQKIIFIFLPAYIVTLYLDVTNGPIFMQTTRPYFFIVLPVFVIADSLVHTLFKKLISNVTRNQYFIECPSCHFNNIHLVETCANCSYKKGDILTGLAAEITPTFKGDKIPSGLMQLLSLGMGEEIIFHKKLTLSSQQLKNSERVVRKHLVITTASLITLDYFSFHIHMPKSWRERDVIPISEILAVEGRMKKFMKDVCPFLIIKTINGDVYEIVLSTLDNYIAEIKEIAAIIKKAKPQVEITIELYETPLNKFAKSFRLFSTKARGSGSPGKKAG